MNIDLFPEIFTPRLKLRKPLETDAKSIARLRSDADVNKYILKRAKYFSEQEAADFISRILAGIDNGTNFYWIITEKEQTELIGTICLWKFSADRKTAEAGYELMPQYQQRGLMTEALSGVISFAKNELHLHELKAFTNFQNQTSLQLLKKLGFIFKPDEKDVEYPDNVIYSLRMNQIK
ncbi:MAG: GNAT family N-acetyltransferase [Bacteroidia bacterium]